ncbi:hypothetical protein FSARC_2078 [Fusarium sarcochroum]|uniref:BZIP domain-containing protein n=1 Tax=Fusarium sarcochroum TaxID=1208366 RepID=A0A8H4U7E7_9HYPO|nr:hypothetical protein FSARC_2078 [Fusarium sarcochroum]
MPRIPWLIYSNPPLSTAGVDHLPYNVSLIAILGGRAPLNLNQWQQRVHRQPAASATRPCPGSLINAPAPTGDISDFGLFSDTSPFLDLLPVQYDFDAQAIYQDLDDATWDFGNNIDTQTNTGDGLFDQIMIPDMNVNLDTQQQLDIGDGFFSQEQPLLTVNSSPLEQTSTSSTPHPTTNTNKSPSASSIPGTSTFSLHPSPSSSSGSSRKRKSPEDEDSAANIKRQRNTLAARKYRQKRLDRITELEDALASMTNERDDMRLQLARREAEVDALREMLGKK